MLTREEQARLDELCWIYGIKGATDGERYGRLVWTLLDISGETNGERFGKLALRLAKKGRGRTPFWTRERLLMLLDLFEAEIGSRSFREVKRPEEPLLILRECAEWVAQRQRTAPQLSSFLAQAEWWRVSRGVSRVDGWHYVDPPGPATDVWVCRQLQRRYPELFKDYTDKKLAEKVSEARSLRGRLLSGDAADHTDGG